MATLPSDLLLPIVQATSLTLQDLASLLRLSSQARRTIPLYISRLHLTIPTLLSRLLELFSVCTHLLLLSGNLLVDLPLEVVPWFLVRYERLTVQLLTIDDYGSIPEGFSHLFLPAVRDESKSLILYDNHYYLMGEVKEGYVSDRLYFRRQHTNYRPSIEIKVTKILKLLPDDYIGIDRYCAIWFRGLWGFGNHPTPPFDRCKKLEYLCSDCPLYLSPDTLNACSNLQVLGSNVLVTAWWDDGPLNHPTLSNLNVDAREPYTLDWALKQGLPLTLYAPKEMLPIIRAKYSKDPRVTGFMPLLC